MASSLTYRPIRPGEERRVFELVEASFREFVGHEYTAEGVEEFLRYADPRALAERLGADHFVLVALAGNEPVGMIELRGNEHLSNLFVDRRYHRRGIARELLRRALQAARRARPDLERVTVNSSRYALPVYERLGFAVTGPEATVNGILFVPMALELGRTAAPEGTRED